MAPTYFSARLVVALLLATLFAAGEARPQSPGIVLSTSQVTHLEGDYYSGSYTLRLAAAPSDTVMVSISGNDATKLEVFPSQLTFTTQDWSMPQSVDLLAYYDSDGIDESLSLRHTASGGGYDNVTVDLDVVIIDVDTAGVVLSATEVAVLEEGSSSYEVWLATEPTESVTVQIGGASASTLTLSQPTLTFTSENWNIAQTVTVTAVDDVDSMGHTVSLSHTPSGGDYGSVTGDDVVVHVTDNDAPGLFIDVVSLTLDSGGNSVYKVRLAKAPSGGVDVAITVSGSGLTVVGDNFSFSQDDWDDPVSVTLIADHDGDQDAVDSSVTLVHTASGSDYGSVSASVPVTIVDPDEAGLTLSGTSLTLDEGGVSDSYTVVLDTLPSDTVTVTVDGHAGTDLVVNPTALTFTISDWNTAQAVTVAAGPDADGANDLESLTHTASGGDYDGVKGADVVVEVTDDDDPALVLSTALLSVTEGASASYTVNLATEPTDTVTVAISGHESTDLTVTPPSLTFTKTDWNTPETVNVMARDDMDQENDVESLTHTASGGDYESVASQSLDVEIVDDDDPALVLSTALLSVTEGASASYTVNLATEPTDTVTVAISGHESTDLTVTPPNLTFTTTDWNTPKPVNVVAGLDQDEEDDRELLTHTASGGDYAGLTQNLEVVVRDVPMPGLLLSTTAVNVLEGGTASYTVALATEPTDTVTVAIGGATDTILTLERPNLTFTTSNWNVAQTVTVTADQNSGTGDASATLTHAASGGDYRAVTGDDVAVAITDDDAAGLFIDTAHATVAEGGPSFYYTLRLAAEPSATVTVEIILPPEQQLQASPQLLTFKISDWSDPQVIELSAFDDIDSVGYLLELRHEASGGNYDGVRATLHVAVSDNDSPGLVLQGTPLNVLEGGTASYTVALTAAPTENVVVRIGGFPATLLMLDSTSLTFTTDDWATEQEVTVTAIQNSATGDASAVLTHEATGGAYDGLRVLNVNATIVDDDSVGLFIDKGVMKVNAGRQASYTLRLTKAPSNQTTVNVVSSDPTSLSLPQSQFTYETTNWDVPQSVSVIAVVDSDDDALNEYVELRHTAAGTDYTNVSASVGVTILDPDVPNLILSTSSLTVREGGSSTYSVELATQPTDTVTVAIREHEHGGTGVLLLSPPNLSFGQVDWNTPKTISVEAPPDDDADHDFDNLFHYVSGGDYEGVDGVFLPVFVTDDDSPGLVLSHTSLKVPEGGSTRYTVALATEPSARVTVSIAKPTSTDLKVQPREFTFTKRNWSSPKTVTVSALEDLNAVAESESLMHKASGGDYGSVQATGNVEVIDNDFPMPELSVSSLKVRETGQDSYAVTLSHEPADPVTVTITGQQDRADLLPSDVLVFSDETWNFPQNVTVKPLVDPDRLDSRFTLSHTASGGRGAGAVDLPVIVTDEIGGLVLDPDALSVAANGHVDYTVALAVPPSDTVTVAISEAVVGTGLTIDPASLTFTTRDWARPRTVRVAAESDAAERSKSVTLVHTAVGGGYGSVMETLDVAVLPDPSRPVPTLHAGEASLTVTWAAIDSPTPTSYDVRYRPSPTETTPEPAWTLISVSSLHDEPLHTLLTGLERSRPYEVQVRALFADTLSPLGRWSPTASGTPAEDPPGQGPSSLGLQLPTDLPLGAELSCARSTDGDLFHFTLTDWQSVMVETQGDLDTQFAVLSGAPSRLAFSPFGYQASLQVQNNAYDGNALLWGHLPPGQYSFEVFAEVEASPEDECGPYRVILRILPETTGLGDAQAVRVGVPAWSLTELRSRTFVQDERVVRVTGDVDYFRFTLDHGADVLIHTGPLGGSPAERAPRWNSSADTIGELLDGNGTSLGIRDDGEIPAQPSQFVFRRALAAGTYFVRVWSYQALPYTLNVEVVSNPVGTSIATALPFELRKFGIVHRRRFPTRSGTFGLGRLNSTAESHYFRFAVDDPTHVFIRGVSDEMQIVGDLVNADGDPVPISITTDHYSERDSTFGFVIHGALRTAGSFFVRVSSASNAGGYVLAGTENRHQTQLEANCRRFPNDFSDPLYPCQWNLKNDGLLPGNGTHLNGKAGEDIRVEEVWESGNLGAGVTVAIVDSGCHENHPDLKEGFDKDRGWNYYPGDFSNPFNPRSNHGTAVASLIGARANAIGIRGIAPSATLVCRNLIAGRPADEDAADAMVRDLDVTAVVNNSWGFPDGGGLYRETPSLFPSAIETGIEKGFGGKGIVYVWAAGNGAGADDESALGGREGHYGVIAVGAVDDFGVRSPYSEEGSNLWISAPSNSYGDRPQIYAASNFDAQSSFGGTSAAAPQVAGVAALVRAANANLTWRDVKLILAGTARKNDSVSDGWLEGSAKYGTEGRYHFNREYGFGVVDAAAAVSLADGWPSLPPFVRSELTGIDARLAIPDRDSTSAAEPVASAVMVEENIDFLEHVDVEMDLRTARFRDLRIELVSPTGSVSRLLSESLAATDQSVDGVVTLGTARHLGENFAGLWTLRITDYVEGNATWLRSWGVVGYGHRAGPPALGRPTLTPASEGKALRVEWGRPPKGPVTGYSLRVRPTGPGGGTWLELANVSSGDSTTVPIAYTVTGLLDDTEYEVQVRAENDKGVGGWSPSATARTLPKEASEPRLDISPSPLSVPEGGKASYTVRLLKRPSAAVTVEISVPSTAGIGLDRERLIFTVSDWWVRRNVVVSGNQDDDDENAVVELVHTPSGGGYEAVAPASLEVIVADGDTQALAVSPPVLFVEEGEQAAYTVRLAARPAEELRVVISGFQGTGLRLDRASLNYTPANWAVEQRVNVSAAEDRDDQGETATLVHTVAQDSAVRTDLRVSIGDTENRVRNLSAYSGGNTLTLVWDGPPSGLYHVRYIPSSADKSVALNWTNVPYVQYGGGGPALWKTPEEVHLPKGFLTGRPYTHLGGLANGVSYDVQVRRQGGAWSAIVTGTPQPWLNLPSPTMQPTAPDVVLAGRVAQNSHFLRFEVTEPAGQSLLALSAGRTQVPDALKLHQLNGGHVSELAAVYPPELGPGPLGWNLLSLGAHLEKGNYYLEMISSLPDDEMAGAFQLTSGGRTLAGARPVSIDSVNWSYLSSESDAAYFRVSVWDATDVMIRGSSESDPERDLALVLLDGEGRTVARNQDGLLRESILDGRVLRAPLLRSWLYPETVSEPADYYVKVTGSGAGVFSLTLEAVHRVGSNFRSATPLRFGEPRAGRLPHSDFFRLELPERTHVLLSAVSRDDGLLFEVYDHRLRPVTDGLHVARFQSAEGVHGSVLSGRLAAGPWYLQVSDSVPNRSAAYAIVLIEDTAMAELDARCRLLAAFLVETDVKDPLASCQPHLIDSVLAERAIGVEGVWRQGNTGAGVRVAVVDDGLDEEHPDLAPNVNGALGHSYGAGLSGLFNPYGGQRSRTGDRGTAAAGLIAAKADSAGVRGVAPGAEVYGLNLATGLTDANVADAMTRHLAVTGVSSNGWLTGHSVVAASAVFDAAVNEGLVSGFGGRGLLYVAPVGDFPFDSRDFFQGLLSDFSVSQNANHDGRLSHFGVVPVASVPFQMDENARMGASRYGANLWISAPTGDTLTPRGVDVLTYLAQTTYAESASYPVATTLDGGRYGVVGGSHAAAAVVAGVAALLRSENPDLSWRDIKLLLAATARQYEEGRESWSLGAAVYKGMGNPSYRYSHEFGFGLVDAAAAVALAGRWSALPDFVESEEYRSAISLEVPDASAVAPGDTVASIIDVGGEVEFVEFVEITLELSDVAAEADALLSDLRIDLVSPTGAVSVLNFGGIGRRTAPKVFRFGSARHLGEDPEGRWTLRVADQVEGAVAFLRSWSLRVYGHRVTPARLVPPSLRADAKGLSVAWEPPAGSASGGPLGGYDLRFRRVSVLHNGDWRAVPRVARPGTLSHVLVDVVKGVEYEVQVRAYNGGGAGSWSDSAAIVALGPGERESLPLDADTAFWVREGGERSWVVSLGTLPTAGLKLEISGHEGTGLTVSPTSLDFFQQRRGRMTVRVVADTDADTVDEEVLLRVTAVGGGLLDGLSAEVKVLIADDSPVSGLKAYSGDNSATVVWRAPERVPTGAVAWELRYRVAGKGGADLGVLRRSSEGIEILRGLVNGTTYEVTVRGLTQWEGYVIPDAGPPAVLVTPRDTLPGGPAHHLPPDGTPIGGFRWDSTDDERWLVRAPAKGAMRIYTTGELDMDAFFRSGFSRPIQLAKSLPSLPGQVHDVVPTEADEVLFIESGEAFQNLKHEPSNPRYQGPFAIHAEFLREARTADEARELHLGGTQWAHVPPDGEADYYRFSLESATVVLVRSGPLHDLTGDVSGELLDSGGRSLLGNRDGWTLGAPQAFMLVKALPAGTYYVKVSQTPNGRAAYPFYSVDLREVGPVATERSGAVPLGLGTYLRTVRDLFGLERLEGGFGSGRISGADESNYFRVAIPRALHVLGRVQSSIFWPEVSLSAEGGGGAADLLERRFYAQEDGLKITQFSAYLAAGSYILGVSGAVAAESGYVLRLVEDPQPGEVASRCSDGGLFGDALISCQWHLTAIRAPGVWASGNLGEGVIVAVVNSGLEEQHPDLAENVAVELGHDYEPDRPPILFSRRSRIGTNVAGLIAARDNTVGGRGVAPRARIVDFDLWQNGEAGVTDALLVDSLTRRMEEIAVSNHGGRISGGSAVAAAVETGVAAGYGGRGIVYVKASYGSAFQTRAGQYERMAADHGVINVGSVARDGSHGSYSAEGAGLWVSAYGEKDILTTDVFSRYRVVEGNADSVDAAAAMVSGVVALIRAENSSLSWRDVKLILAASARRNDASDAGWLTGAEKYGGDGSYSYNHKYGFGVVDAKAAVDLAGQWSRLPSLVRLDSERVAANLRIPEGLLEGGVAVSAIDVGAGVDFVEHVELLLDLESDDVGELTIQLVSPAGRVSTLWTSASVFAEAGSPHNALPSSLRFGSARHLGEPAKGRWTLRVSDDRYGVGVKPAVLKSWQLRVSGHSRRGVVSAGDLVLSTSAFSVAEGSSAEFSLRLSKRPAGPVTVGVAGWEGTDLAVRPTELTFSAAEWNRPQKVTVSAMEDPDVGDDFETLVLTATGSGFGPATAEVVVSVRDKTVGRLLPSLKLLAVEEGDFASFTVALSHVPAVPVTVTATGWAGSRLTVRPATWTFQPGGGYQPATVTVWAFQDTDLLDQEETLVLAASGGAFEGAAERVTVRVSEKTTVDPPPPPDDIRVGFGRPQWTVAEGETVTVEVLLGRSPPTSVSVGLVKAHYGGATEMDYTALPPGVTFEPGELVQRFEFSAVDDSEDDDGEAVVLRFGDLPAGVVGNGQAILAIQDNDGGDGGDGDGGDGGGGDGGGDGDGGDGGGGDGGGDGDGGDGGGGDGDGGGGDGGGDGDGGDGGGGDGDGGGGDGGGDGDGGDGGGGDGDGGGDGGGGDGDGGFSVAGATCKRNLCGAVSGQALRFDGGRPGAFRSWLWDFGDGATSTSAAPEHSWASPGFYEVVLRKSDGTRTWTSSRTFLVEAAVPAGTCESSGSTRCLQDSRYSVTVEWWPVAGDSGVGKVVPAGTNDSGLFRFFDQSNWEVLVKVLDGCGVNGAVWVFAASTTDLGYEISVEDTVTGLSVDYVNEAGVPASAVTDVAAFPDACEASGR